MTLTVMDWFCGAGGSSQGIDAVPGVDVTLAANHWQLALDTHAANFPSVRHERGDIRELDVQDWPVADGFWASPECTKFTGAQGIPLSYMNEAPTLPGMEPETDEAADRSRALMWDVPKYLEGVQRRGKLVKFGVVENVAEAFKSPQFPPWLRTMHGLDYETFIIAFNSMHAQDTKSEECCQSRNRGYVGYIHKSVGRTPDWDKWLRPRTHCPSCDTTVSAIKAWKKPGTVMGSYGAQYVYRCPATSCRGKEIVPATLPAAAAIDLNIRAPRIGDRTSTQDKPEGLKPATIRRIRAGIDRHWGPLLVPSGGTWRTDATPLDQPMPTRTTRENDGLAVPPLLVPLEARAGLRIGTIDESLRTQTGRRETAMALPPVMVTMRGGGSLTASTLPDIDPMATVSAGGNHHGLIQPPLLVPYYGTGIARTVADPIGALSTRDRYALATRDAEVLADFDIADVRFRMLEPSEVGAAMAFRPDYTVLGSRRDRVRQYGNAVTPPVAELLVSALVEAVTGEDLVRAA